MSHSLILLVPLWIFGSIAAPMAAGTTVTLRMADRFFNPKPRA